MIGLDVEGMEDIPESVAEDFNNLVEQALEAHSRLPPEVWMQGFMQLKPAVQSWILATLQYGEPF